MNLITEEACQEFAVKLPRKLIEDLNALAGEVGVTWFVLQLIVHPTLCRASYIHPHKWCLYAGFLGKVARWLVRGEGRVPPNGVVSNPNDPRHRRNPSPRVSWMRCGGRWQVSWSPSTTQHVRRLRRMWKVGQGWSQSKKWFTNYQPCFFPQVAVAFSQNHERCKLSAGNTVSNREK